MSRHLLDVREVSVCYDSGEAGVRHVSFTLDAGEVLGLAGETGAGKSTLARACCALEPLAAGRVLVDGCCVASVDRSESLTGDALRRYRSKFQILFQDPASSLSPRMTVEQIVAEGALAHRLWQPDDVTARVEAALREVNLAASVAGCFPNELSGGERRRVALARVGAVRPKLLFLDEPTAGLDQDNIADVMTLLRGLVDQWGMGLVLISHDLGVLRDQADRILVMRGGEILEDRSTDELFREPRHAYSRALIQAATGNKAWID